MSVIVELLAVIGAFSLAATAVVGYVIWLESRRDRKSPRKLWDAKP